VEKTKDTILYVDDETTNLELLKAILEKDYNIITETSTSEAYKILKKKDIKIIIADQLMPEETGLAFLERITPEFPDIIKIIFTAVNDSGTAINAVNQGGIYRYLLKPLNKREMKITLENGIREYDLKLENKTLLNELKVKNLELEKAYRKLQESEKKFHSIFANSSDGIAIFKDNEILDANPAFLNTIGYPNASFKRDDINAFVRTNFPRSFNNNDNSAEVSDNTFREIELSFPNAQKKALELHNCTLELKNDKTILSIVRDITERKQIEQRILETIIKTQEEDQAKYARELHDGLGPVLSTLKMYVEWLANNSNNDKREKISNQSIHCVDHAIDIVKEIANNLSPHVLQRFGLVNAVQTYINTIKDTNDIDIILSSNLTGRLPNLLETALYRIVLECFHNSLKHAKATKIIIKFKTTGNLLTILYSDNGKGFDVDKTMTSNKGMGLFNMKNRVKAIGGELHIKSEINTGTNIEINLIANSHES
jgi:PAS domain S-box-containing protein